MFARVPEGNRKLAVQLLHEVVAGLFVQVRDDFGVGLRREAVPAVHEVAAQLDVVEDLAVEDDLDGAVLVADGLLAAFEVDDAEAPVDQAHLVPLAVDVEALAVGPAMHQRGAHRGEPRLGEPAGIAIKCQDARDAAHALAYHYTIGSSDTGTNLRGQP